MEVKVTTRSKVEGALLTFGVPFGRGQLQKGCGLRLTFQGRDLPLWWEERACWPDGSVKWVFLHTRVPAGENELVLSVADAEPPGRVELVGGRLEVGEVVLEVSEDGWTFLTPEGSWRLEDDLVLSEPELELLRTPWEVQLLEPSPISPLVRLRPRSAEEGLLVDQLLRLDPEGRRIIWCRRMTWHREGKYFLVSAKAELVPGRPPEGKGAILVPRPGRVMYDGGPEVEGYPEGRWDGEEHSLWVEKAWQRGPFGIRWGRDGLEVSFYPEEAEPLPVTGGTSFRHTVHLSCGGRAREVAGHRVEFVVDPGHLCSSGALGLLPPPDEKEGGPDFPGFERALRAALDSGRLSRLSGPDSEAGPPVPLEDEARQDPDYFGLQHYGDWPMPWGSYGGKRRMYADNEYDVAYAYFQGYARYGDWRYMEVARHSAIHMTDVDRISTTGDMRFHGYYEQAEDHGHARSESGELGHYWTDGYWMQYFLNGDVWAKESALEVTEVLLGLLMDGEEGKRRAWSTAERNLGWPLVALMGTYESTGDVRALECARQIAEYIEKFTSDPDKEVEGTRDVVWWRTAMQDGCKPFMLGIVMEGLERYHRATGDRKAARAIVNLARFLVEKMWLPHRATFIYEWNAYNRKHRFQRPHDLVPLFVRGLGYAYELTGDDTFREVSEKAFHGCLWTLYDPSSGGKSIGQIGRSLGGYVAMLRRWLEEDEEKYRASIPPSTGEGFRWESEVRELLESGHLELVEGDPRYEGDYLISEGGSFVAARFKRPVATDEGEIELTVSLNPGSTTWLNRRCYIHLCDDVLNRSCVSLIMFYRGIHLRMYDPNGRLIEVPEGGVEGWREGEPHRIRVVWEAPGEAVLYVDGREVDRRPLDRPIGGRFTRIHIGHRPGNWRAHARIRLHRLEFRPRSHGEVRDA